jgi:diacylglycerol O-acyltransferase-1
MKLVSYAHANSDLRGARRAAGAAKKEDSGSEGDAEPSDAYALVYPANLNLLNLAYFIAAPTLCYQPSYPRSPRFRGRWLLRRLAELLLVGGLMLLLIEQYLLPAVAVSVRTPLVQLGPFGLLERVLKLSIPTLYVWLCMFYCFFHCWLNVLGEVLRFGDRLFYREWWNATTIEAYWRLWNIPVHKWLARHLYFPLIRAGCSRTQAMFVTFLFSAAAHELLVGVPCHVLRLWAFGGIMAQLPLIAFTNWTSRKLSGGGQLGNVAFWLSFCILGQPMAVLLYYRDAVEHRTREAAAMG